MTCAYYWNPRHHNALEPCREPAVGVGGVMHAPECQQHREAREEADVPMSPMSRDHERHAVGSAPWPLPHVFHLQGNTREA